MASMLSSKCKRKKNLTFLEATEVAYLRLPKAALKPVLPCTGKSQAPTTGVRLWGVWGLGLEGKAVLQGGS